MSVLRSARILAAVAVAGALVVTAAPAHAGGRTGPSVVARGLDNPRGLGFAPDGSLWVAESGRGGSGPCQEGPEGETCFGRSGAVTRIAHGHQRRVVTRLPSLAAPDGTNASGPADVSVDRSGRVYLTIGLGGDPALRRQVPQLAGMAKLYRVTRHAPVVVADIGGHEARSNPDGKLPPDTNPFGVQATAAGQVVADAGGNSLVAVDRRGRTRTVAVFASRTVPAPAGIPGLPAGTPIPMESVPTSVVKGPDGAYYVGELTGFPFQPGAARVWQVVPGHTPTVYARGFTNIIDLAFGPDRKLYVLEIAKNGLLSGDPAGALLRANRHGAPTVVLAKGLITPGGLAIRGRAAYVSNCGTCAGTGTVLRIALR
jgi:hypothetical protein